mmetsp:Transcript_23627/g.48324  ORF Transcript_23627/g.48324 Transcript_23627/m.48324 type:complete len:283 (-) Transcript_23627:78-926(-)
MRPGLCHERLEARINPVLPLSQEVNNQQAVRSSPRGLQELRDAQVILLPAQHPRLHHVYCVFPPTATWVVHAPASSGGRVAKRRSAIGHAIGGDRSWRRSWLGVGIRNGGGGGLVVAAFARPFVVRHAGDHHVQQVPHREHKAHAGVARARFQNLESSSRASGRSKGHVVLRVEQPKKVGNLARARFFKAKVHHLPPAWKHDCLCGSAPFARFAFVHLGASSKAFYQRNYASDVIAGLYLLAGGRIPNRRLNLREVKLLEVFWRSRTLALCANKANRPNENT